MAVKSKEIVVRGIVNRPIGMYAAELHCICTNDKKGKTLSIDDGVTQFSIPFEAVEKYFKEDNR